MLHIYSYYIKTVLYTSFLLVKFIKVACVWIHVHTAFLLLDIYHQVILSHFFLFFKLIDVSLIWIMSDVACSRCCWYPTQISLAGPVPPSPSCGYWLLMTHTPVPLLQRPALIDSKNCLNEIYTEITDHAPPPSLFPRMTHSQWLFRSETAQPPLPLDWVTSSSSVHT